MLRVVSGRHSVSIICPGFTFFLRWQRQNNMTNDLVFTVLIPDMKTFLKLL